MKGLWRIPGRIVEGALEPKKVLEIPGKVIDKTMAV